MRLPRHTVDVEPGRLRLFAKTIGETDPVYSDATAAREAGYASLPVPPTFLFCLDMEVDEPYAYLETMGVTLGRVLHGEQHFRYHAMAYAGDRLCFDSVISDIYSRRGGALEFIVRDTAVTGADGRPVADLSAVLVVRGDGREGNR